MFVTTTSRISKSASKYVSMYGYAFRRALRYGAETWHEDRGRAHDVLEHIFEATPPKVKGQGALKCSMDIKFGRKNPLTEV